MKDFLKRTIWNKFIIWSCIFCLIASANALTLSKPWPRLGGAIPLDAPEVLPHHLVLIADFDPLKGTFRPLCSGVLLKDQIIVTVAHGVRYQAVEKLAVLFQVQQGLEDTFSWEAFLLESLYLPIDQEPSNPFHDIAVLELADSIITSSDNSDISMFARPGPLTLVGWNTVEGQLIPGQMGIQGLELNQHQREELSDFAVDSDHYLFATPVDALGRISKGISGSPIYTTDPSGSPEFAGMLSYQFVDPNSKSRTLIATSAKSVFEIVDHVSNDQVPSNFERIIQSLLDEVESEEFKPTIVNLGELIHIDRPGEFAVEFSKEERMSQDGSPTIWHFLLSGESGSRVRIQLSPRRLEKSFTPFEMRAYSYPEHSWLGSSQDGNTGEILNLPETTGEKVLLRILVKDSGVNSKEFQPSNALLNINPTGSKQAN
jgi:hypothetical protein